MSNICVNVLAAAVAFTCAGGLCVRAEAQPVVVTFDGLDAQGWTGPQGPGGATTVDAGGGNPGACIRTVFNNFGITFSNDTNGAFIGDLGRFASVTIGTDIQSSRVEFFGTPVSRDWIIELRDFDNPPGGYPWVSVWYDLGDISSGQPWRTLSVMIADTRASGLPAGWGGYGDEDPVTFEPRLPPGRTFASVLAGVDEIAFTTLTPGFFFGFTDFDVRLDNIRIEGAARCRADFNGAGGVTVQDVFDFLTAWFAGDPRADFNGAAGITVQDVFDFLSAWFAGC